MTSTWLSNGDGPFKGSATGEYASRVKHRRLVQVGIR